MPRAGRAIRAVALGLGGVLAAAALGTPPAASAAGNLYASDWTQGAVSAFSVDSVGLPAQLGTGITSTGSQPAGVAISTNGQTLYVANENQGTVSTFSIGAGGTLTQVGPPVLSGNSNSTTNSQPYGVAVSPNGENVYVANYLSSTVSVFTIGAGGVLTQQGTGITSGSAGPGWLAVAPNGENLYVTNYTGGTVSTFSIGAGGMLSPQGGPISTGSGNGSEPENVAISPNGQDLYVVNHADGTVSTFAIGAGGALVVQGAPVPTGTTIASGPEGIAIAPNGANLYVTNENEGSVSTFSIGAGGALTAAGTTGPLSGTATSAQPFGAAVAPSGQYLYVANFALGSISAFAIGAGGMLTAQGDAVLSGSSSGSGAYELVVSPDQGPTAAEAATVSPIAPAAVFSGQGSTPGSAPIATYAWQFSDGTRQTGPLVTHIFHARGRYTVTLTVTDTDSCSIFGPFTGQSAYCIADPAAITSRVITVPSPPQGSRGSITGVARAKPKLAFTLTRGTLAPSLVSVAVTLPKGLTFSSRKQDLARHIVITGANRRPAKYAAAVRHGVLTVTVASAQTSLRVTIVSPELSASKHLVTEVKPSKHGKRHKPVKLTFRLKLTDIARDAMNLSLKTTAR
ncbi:MAG TPA: beta-propeller fold lactonase family protein [Solirubrobacteraceae bacterium]|nr:beta-propeller fold lactonase family protein [Solirubrobacteraceae bacterium]